MKVLIVDEETWLMEAIFDRLTHQYGEGSYAYCDNGYDGINILRQGNFSAVVLDMMLPLGGDLKLPTNEPGLMYGVYILRIIRETFSETSLPVICYTVIESPEVQRQISSLGGKYVCKLEENGFDELFNVIAKYN